MTRRRPVDTIWPGTRRVMREIAFGGQGIGRRLRRRPRLHVDLSAGLRVTPSGEFSGTNLFLTAVNAGSTPVTLREHSIRLSSGQRLDTLRPWSSVDYPHTLQPGESCRIYYDLPDIAARLRQEGHSGVVRLLGFFTSEPGGVTQSQHPVEVDIDEWA